MTLSRLHGASFALALFVHYLTVYLCGPFNSEAIEDRLWVETSQACQSRCYAKYHALTLQKHYYFITLLQPWRDGTCASISRVRLSLDYYPIKPHFFCVRGGCR